MSEPPDLDVRREGYKGHRIQLAFLAMCIAVLAGLVLWAVYVLAAVDRSMELYDLGEDATRLASTLVFNWMTAIAQITIAIIGGIWALLMFGGSRARRVTGVSRGFFLLANIALVSSLVVYTVGYDAIVERLFHHGAFDVDAPFAWGIKWCQLWLFVKGCVDLVGTAFTARA